MASTDQIATLLARLCDSVDALSEAVRTSSSRTDTPDDPAYHEILTEEEVANLTGLKSRARQIKWLQDRGWKYAQAAGGRPIIGREYLRYKLGGVKPKAEPAPQWVPDFSRIND
jgi:hypothetical protein